MKTQIRKELSETSSSSEDSLSLYQEMKLYILPESTYKKFKENEMYVKLDDIHPSYTDDADKVLAANEISIEEAKIAITGYDMILYEPTYICDSLCFFEHYYTNHDIYISSLRRYYSSIKFFEYSNHDDVIFGFYGYKAV